jgi:UPF0176 protein
MDMTPSVVAALYLFVRLPDYQEIAPRLKAHCDEFDIKGTLLLAEEGINGTVSGSRSAIDGLINFLKADERFSGLSYKESFYEDKPFYRMKVKLKKEIVTMGVNGIDPQKIVGTYVKPRDWNSLISDPDVVVIDTRNSYEYNIGTFERALDPKTETFREFPSYVAQNLDPAKHKKVAMSDGAHLAAILRQLGKCCQRQKPSARHTSFPCHAGSAQRYTGAGILRGVRRRKIPAC